MSTPTHGEAERHRKRIRINYDSRKVGTDCQRYNLRRRIEFDKFDASSNKFRRVEK